MYLQTLTSRWWEAAVVVLGVNSVVFGVLFTNNGYAGWATAVGFVPAVLLITGLGTRRRWPLAATVMLVAGSLLAAVAWWVMYTVALAAVIILGGFSGGKLRIRGEHPATI